MRALNETEIETLRGVMNRFYSRTSKCVPQEVMDGVLKFTQVEYFHKGDFSVCRLDSDILGWNTLWGIGVVKARSCFSTTEIERARENTAFTRSATNYMRRLLRLTPKSFYTDVPPFLFFF